MHSIISTSNVPQKLTSEAIKLFNGLEKRFNVSFAVSELDSHDDEDDDGPVVVSTDDLFAAGFTQNEIDTLPNV